MPEIFHHTDHAGDAIKLLGGGEPDRTLILAVYPTTGFVKAVEIPEVDGLRLLAALLKHYGQNITEADHG